MNREGWILTAFAVLFAAGITVTVCGVILFLRDVRTRRDYRREQHVLEPPDA